jgi:hypothetical protein
MPLKDQMKIRDRNFSDRNDPNEYDNNFENDISNDITKFRFAKQPKMSI